MIAIRIILKMEINGGSILAYILMVQPIIGERHGYKDMRHLVPLNLQSGSRRMKGVAQVN